MRKPCILVTGFEPYGGRSLNPAHEVMQQLAGRNIGGGQVNAHPLPVAIKALPSRISTLMDEVKPDIVISLGLYPGESVIRIERAALNVLDFPIADNAGDRPLDQPICPTGPAALMATLPIRAIEKNLLTEGIPAQVSNTAGTYLCNACLYGFLQAACRLQRPVQCGFLHLPYLPRQVADLLVRSREKGTAELNSAPPAMSLDLQLKAVELAITTSQDRA